MREGRRGRRERGGEERKERTVDNWIKLLKLEASI
jgi:hypothetical protein